MYARMFVSWYDMYHISTSYEGRHKCEADTMTSNPSCTRTHIYTRMCALTRTHAQARTRARAVRALPRPAWRICTMYVTCRAEVGMIDYRSIENIHRQARIIGWQPVGLGTDKRAKAEEEGKERGRRGCSQACRRARTIERVTDALVP